MPPKLPPDALTPPPASQREAMPSPFDDQVISSAPPPTPARGALQPSMWMDRSRFPLVKPEHAEELEQLAAVNEFGRRMPREKAEAEAYAHYRKKQHLEAAIHHLAGQRAAQAVGDLESARKHSLMYGLHSKALGHEPVGPVHPDVKAGLSAAPPRVYRYKAHKGDMLALAPHVTEHGATASAPPPPALGKAEVDALLVLRKACEVLTKGEKEFKPLTGDKLCTAKTGKGLTGCQSKAKFSCGGNRYCLAHAKKYGYKEPEGEPVKKGDVVQFPGNPAPAEDKGKEASVHTISSDPREKRKIGSVSGFDKYDYSDHLPPEHQQRGIKLFVFHNPKTNDTSGSLANSAGALMATHKYLGPDRWHTTGARLPDALADALMNAVDSHRGQNGFTPEPIGKGEVDASGRREKMVRKGGVCRCDAYKFPHRAHSHPTKPCK